MNQINQINKTNQFDHPAGNCFRGRLERLRRQERCEYFRRLRGDFGQKSLHFDVGEDDVRLTLKGFVVAPFKSTPLREKILDVRGSLLSLHKALILAEQVTYERINGRVESTSELLHLVLNDPWFTWLHPLSQLVVRIDELLDDKSELSLVEVEHFLIEARSLIRPSEEGDGFERSYYEALQREPDVIFAHVEVKRLLTKVAA